MTQNLDDWLLQVKGLDVYGYGSQRSDYSAELLSPKKQTCKSAPSLGNVSEGCFKVLEQLLEHYTFTPANLLVLKEDEIQITVTLHRDVRITVDCKNKSCTTDPHINSLKDVDSLIDLFNSSSYLKRT